MIVVRLFLAVSWVCLWFVIVVFPGSYSLTFSEYMHAKNRVLVAINLASPPFKKENLHHLISPYRTQWKRSLAGRFVCIQGRKLPYITIADEMVKNRNASQDVPKLKRT